MRILIENIIRQLNDVQVARNWMGSSFKARLERIDPDVASPSRSVADTFLEFPGGGSPLNRSDRVPS